MRSPRRRIGVTTGRAGNPATAGRAGNPAVVLLALGLALTGCGSGDDVKPAAPQGSDPTAWAGAFCGGLGEVIAGVAAIAKAQPTPQGQKDGLLAFSDSVQRGFADTARKLEQLGPPGITNGKQVHDTAVNFFATTAETVGDQRDKLAALDANDPEFVQKASQLAGPDLSGASATMRDLTNNNELTPAFRAAPECQRLGAAAGQR
ncbi:MAG: hypothetical protein M3460_15250 [Actinomycetota bacterium]|nr:hypothetical protein [Actinomycetota bacterium]